MRIRKSSTTSDTERKIISIISSIGDKNERSITNIARKFAGDNNLPQKKWNSLRSTVKYHLKKMEEEGKVTSKKIEYGETVLGKRIYVLRDERDEA